MSDRLKSQLDELKDHRALTWFMIEEHAKQAFKDPDLAIPRLMAHANRNSFGMMESHAKEGNPAKIAWNYGYLRGSKLSLIPEKHGERARALEHFQKIPALMKDLPKITSDIRATEKALLARKLEEQYEKERANAVYEKQSGMTKELV